MALSLENVEALMDMMRVEFSLRLDAKQDAPIWQARLAEAGATDATLAEFYKGFARQWGELRNNRHPNLNDLLAYVRQSRSVEGWKAKQPAAPDAGILTTIKRMQAKLAGMFRLPESDPRAEEE